MESTSVPKMSYAPFIIGGAILVVIAVVLYFYLLPKPQVEQGPEQTASPGAPGPPVGAPGPARVSAPLAPAVNYDDIMKEAGDPLLQGVVGIYW
jgi:hypothetical protein